MRSQFDHVALSATDIAETVAFYSKQFPSAEVLYQDTSWALLKVGSIKIAFVKEDQHPPHLAFRVETREELDEQATKLGKEVKLHRDGSLSFYFDDPTGNAIEVIHYPSRKS